MPEKLQMFPLIIDKWIGGTRYMTLEEKGLYLELLIYLFTEQKPIKDSAHVARICGIDPRRSARLWPKIAEKFAVNQHGSTHILVSKILNNSGRIKGLDGVGIGGGVPAQEKEKEKDINTHATACGGKPLVSAPKANGIPYQKIVDLYHEKLPMLPRICRLTADRKKKIGARWKNELPDLETWRIYFNAVSRSKFMTGQAEPIPPRTTPFLADIDFLIRASTVTKIEEGKYHR